MKVPTWVRIATTLFGWLLPSRKSVAMRRRSFLPQSPRPTPAGKGAVDEDLRDPRSTCRRSTRDVAVFAAEDHRRHRGAVPSAEDPGRIGPDALDWAL